jgi:hypothetical protein
MRARFRRDASVEQDVVDAHKLLAVFVFEQFAGALRGFLN